jgi:hypothetical protein
MVMKKPIFGSFGKKLLIKYIHYPRECETSETSIIHVKHGRHHLSDSDVETWALAIYQLLISFRPTRHETLAPSLLKREK